MCWFRFVGHPEAQSLLVLAKSRRAARTPPCATGADSVSMLSRDWSACLHHDALVPICRASRGAVPARAGEKPQGCADSALRYRGGQRLHAFARLECLSPPRCVGSDLSGIQRRSPCSCWRKAAGLRGLRPALQGRTASRGFREVGVLVSTTLCWF